MYLMARVIKSMGIKMVLSGEGSDELLVDIYIFTKLQTLKEFHDETSKKIRKITLIRLFESQQSINELGIEGRVPFWIKNLWMLP